MAGSAKSTGRRTRGRPTSDDAAQIEAHLLDVALREFIESGYGGASLSRIVRRAQVSKTTLYTRFASKESLFRAVMDRQIDRAAIETSFRSGEGPPDLESGLRSFANHALDRSLHGSVLEVNRLILSESHRFPELGIAAAERMQTGVDRVTAFLEACGREGGLAIRNPAAAASAFIHMIRGWYINVLVTNRTVSAPERERWVRSAVHTLVTSADDW